MSLPGENVPHTLILAWLLAAGPQCGPLDLDTALALATENSDEVAIKRSELAAAEADLALARAARWLPGSSATLLAGPVPEAHGTVLDPRTSSRTLDGIGPFGRIDISLVQPLYTWGRFDAARDAATAGVEARGRLLQDATSQIQLRVIQLYWGTSLANRLLAIAADVEKSLAEVDQKIKAGLAEGSSGVAPSDRYKLDLYKALLRRRKADAVKGREVAQAALAATLAAPPERVVIPDVALPTPPTGAPDTPEAVSTAIRRRPDLLALDDAILAKTAEARAAHAAQLPQIFVGGTFAYSYAPNRDIQLNPWAGDWFNTLAFGLAFGLRQDLALPLLQAQSRKASAEVATLERQRAGLVRLVETQVGTAVSDVRDAAERLEASRESFRTSRSWFRSAEMDFAAGVAEAKDVLEAYGAYVESQVENATATYELIMARARLDQLTGATPLRRAATCELR